MEMTSSTSLPKKSIHPERSVTIKKAMSQITEKILKGSIMNTWSSSLDTTCMIGYGGLIKLTK
jgi:hypothetical protein